MLEMNSDVFPEAREMDLGEPPVERQASRLPRQETAESSGELLGLLLFSPVVELPIYPRQQFHEDQEPKSPKQVLENEGLCRSKEPENAAGQA